MYTVTVTGDGAVPVTGTGAGAGPWSGPEGRSPGGPRRTVAGS